MMILSFFFVCFYLPYFSLENEPEGVLYGSICIKQNNKKLINNENRKKDQHLLFFTGLIMIKLFQFQCFK